MKIVVFSSLKNGPTRRGRLLWGGGALITSNTVNCIQVLNCIKGLIHVDTHSLMSLPHPSMSLTHPPMSLTHHLMSPSYPLLCKISSEYMFTLVLEYVCTLIQALNHWCLSVWVVNRAN